MLIRIVRMEFVPENIETFKSLFKDSEPLIQNFHGCLYLELLRDIQKNNVFFTYSHWESEEALENYRHSELFRSVWKQTKILFSENPIAYSLIKEVNYKQLDY